MKSRHNRFLMLLTAFAFMAIAGCKESKENSDTRPVVVVQVNDITQDYLLSVEQQCPDINIKWYLSTQSYSGLYKTIDTPPDILTKGSLYFNDKSSFLRDISEELDVNEYSRNIIDNFYEPDGSLHWLPAICTGFCIIANKDLFDKYNIEIPTDYKSLIKADAAFKKHGIDGICWSMDSSWVFQTFLVAQILSADLFNSYEGLKWRRDYFNSLWKEDDFVLDDNLWPEVFGRLKDAISCGLIDSTDMHTGNVEATENFMYGKCAMVTTATSNVHSISSFEPVVLPTFDTKGNAWVPLYMAQSYGISKKVSDDRMEDVKKVFRALRSAQSLQAYNDSRGGGLPLNRDVSILNEFMEPLKKPILDGYSCLAFNEDKGGIVNGLFTTIHRMFEEDLTVEETVALCKEMTLKSRGEIEGKIKGMNDEDSDHVVFTTKESYPLIADETHNNPTNSVLANSALAGINDISPRKFDILLLSEVVGGAPIQKGNYYYDHKGQVSKTSNLKYLFNNNRILYPAKMTVADLIQYLNSAFHSFYRVDDALPVMAGASYVIDKFPDGLPDGQLPFQPNHINAGKVSNTEKCPTRYVCRAIVKDGVELPQDLEIDVMIAREMAFYITEHTPSVESSWKGLEPNFTITDEKGKTLKTPYDFTFRWLTSGHDFCKPSRYVTIHEQK